MDNVSKETRSRIMARVRSKDTRPELAFRRAFFALGFRYRLHVKSLPGVPDVVLAKHHVAIFINGCFWHWHGCSRSRLPIENSDYWHKKIERNQERDKVSYKALTDAGWRVLVIWECALKKRSVDAAVRLAADYVRMGSSMSALEPDTNVPIAWGVCRIVSV